MKSSERVFKWMEMMRSGWLLCLVLFVLGSSTFILRAEVQVSAELSASQIGVGQMAQLQIKVEGSSSVKVPSSVNVEGLDIQYVQQAKQVQIINLKISSSVVYVFRVMGLQAGNFVIPPIELEIDGKKYSTDPLKLLVSDTLGSPGVVQHPSQGSTLMPSSIPSENRSKEFFAELLGIKKSAYVGEVIPVEIRFYFDRRVRAELQSLPEFRGEGFTSRKLGEPNKVFQEINGVPYEIWRFQTNVVPVKAGKLEVTPAVAQVLVQGSVNAPQDIDDIFQQFFSGGGLPSGFGSTQAVTIKSNTAEIDVRALPKENVPSSFSGAIGEFSMSTSAVPLKAKAGEPISLNVQVSGRGNFDAFGSPKLMEANNWRTYSAKADFHAKDAIGFEGEKDFENVMIAQKTMSKTPSVEFSYFDPNQGIYQTITAPPIAVEAEGMPQVTATPSTEKSTATSSDRNESTHGKATPDAPMLNAQWVKSFSPAWNHAAFYLIQLVGAITFIAWVALGWIRYSQQSQRSVKRKRAKRLQSLLASLSVQQGSAVDFYNQAVVWLKESSQQEDSQISPDHLTIEEVISSRPLDDETLESIQRIFRQQAELLYSGTEGRSAISSDERIKVLTTLRNFAAAGGLKK